LDPLTSGSETRLSTITFAASAATGRSPRFCVTPKLVEEWNYYLSFFGEEFASKQDKLTSCLMNGPDILSYLTNNRSRRKLTGTHREENEHTWTDLGDREFCSKCGLE